MQAIAPTVQAIHSRASTARTHPPAEVSATAAQSAAIDPATEQRRSAATGTVAILANADPQEIKREEFKQKLREALRNAVPDPQTPEQAEQLMDQGAANTSAALHGELSNQRQLAAGPIASAADPSAEVQPSSLPAPDRTTLTPEVAGPPPQSVSPEAVVPAPLPPERLDYSSDRQSTDALMSENNITQEQLQRGNDPDFSSLIQTRSDAESHEAAVPAQYRGEEEGIRGQTREGAAGLLDQGLSIFHGSRTQQLAAVAGQQLATRDANAAERTRITATIDQIKNTTRSEVQQILTDMETEAAKIFEDGLKIAETAYEEVFEEEKGGIGAWLTEWGDTWKARINRAFITARAAYDREVSSTIDRVADFVAQKLVQAEQRIDQGRAEVDTFVASLDASVRGFGEEARTAISGEFDAMSDEINTRRDALVDTLAQKYAESRQRLSETEQRLREENKGFWEKVYDATVGVVNKIIEFKNLLLGILARAVDVVLAIIQDPIGFLGNLIRGVKAGLDAFLGNIVEHLKTGLLGWLFGALEGAGIQIPERFDLAGVFNLIFQVLGLTYSFVRQRAVKIVGEPLVARLEQVAEIFIILKNEGLAGLWEMIKEKVLQLKDAVMDQICEWVISRVIRAGITWIIGLLNPAAAFIKACKAIYDIVVFFIERGRQIIDLVNAVIDTLAAIVGGNISAMAGAVEGALVRVLPVAISFLASLLGLGGISDRIRSIIETIRRPVAAAIDWVINKAVALIRKAGQLLTGGGRRAEGDDAPESADPEHDAKVQAGLAAIDIEEQKYLEQGKISREEAENVARNVKIGHPVFKSLTVVDGGQTWDYDYVASPGKRRKGEIKENADAELEQVRGEIREKLQSPWFRVGPYARESVRASDPGSVSRDEQVEIDRIGSLYGDHHTGDRNPGQPKWTGDHQPVSGLVQNANESAELKQLMEESGLPTTISGQRLYPHSFKSYKTQGGTTTAVIQKLKKLERLKGQPE